MMYSEFVEGTGCKENEHNYKVFMNLEAMYMNTNMSKQEVYEYGKKLVDNSKSKEQLELEQEIKKQIEELRARIRENDEDIKWYEEMAETFKACDDKAMVKMNKGSAKWKREENKELRRKIRELKWILAA